MKAFWHQHPWRLRVAVVLLAALAVALVQAWVPALGNRVEELSSDLAWRIGASPSPERRVVVIDIDEKSLAEQGPWPWSRTTLAQLSGKLRQAGALVQVYDITFPDPRDGDDQLAGAWSETAVVTGQIFSLDSSVTPAVGKVTSPLAMARCPAGIPVSRGYYGSAPELHAARPAAGHLTPRIESDGVVRRVPALVCHEGRPYPSLALSALWRAAQPAEERNGVEPDWVWNSVADQAFGNRSLAPAAYLTSPSIPGLVVPVDVRGDMIVPYRTDRRAFVSISATEVLRGAFDPSMLNGAIALIGATAFGIGDTVATPHASVSSGLEVHAQSLAGLLDHRVPYAPIGSQALQWAACLGLAMLLLLLVSRHAGVPAKRLPIAGVAMAATCWAAAAAAQLHADLALQWFGASLFALLAATALAAAELAITRAQRERLSAHLGSYLPQPVAQRLMATDPTGTVQVDRREVSVLVADIRNFSAYATHKRPEETAALLHAFTCIAVDVVERHGGVVENVVGDSVLAVWNAYSDCTEHAEQAFAAAQELLRATNSLLAPAQPPHDDSPVQPLALGVGIETGMAVVGSFGPARRRAHAALGEPVSIAARLQQMTLDLSMPILVGPQLAGRLPAASSEALGEYLLEGLGRQCSLFAPVAWAELVPTEPLWAQAASSGDRHVDSSRWSVWLETGARERLNNTGLTPLGDA